MKILLIIPFLLFFKTQQTEFKLNGKYTVVSNQYEKNYVIFFNDSVYKKVFDSGKEIKGVVEYGKNLIYLKDYESTFKVVGEKTFLVQIVKIKQDELISLRKDMKDTINFCIHIKRKDGPINWLDICQSSGKFIKVK